MEAYVHKTLYKNLYSGDPQNGNSQGPMKRRAKTKKPRERSCNEHYTAITEQLLLPGATWVHLKNIYVVKLAKFIYSRKKSEIWLLPGQRRQTPIGKGHTGVIVMFYTLIGAGIQRAVPLRSVRFRVHTSYLKERKRTINKDWPLVSEKQAEVFTG